MTVDEMTPTMRRALIITLGALYPLTDAEREAVIATVGRFWIDDRDGSGWETLAEICGVTR